MKFVKFILKVVVVALGVGLWITVGGKQIMIEPKWSHILAHVAISVLELMVGGTLIWLTFKRRQPKDDIAKPQRADCL